MNTVDLMIPTDRFSILKRMCDAAQSENTRLAYRKGWRCFVNWCKNEGVSPNSATASNVAEFFVRLGTEPYTPNGNPLSINTLRLYRSALNDYWKRIGRPSPASSVVVDDVIRGISRVRGKKQRRVKALREYEIVEIIERCPSDKYGKRDAALIALGFAAALRRSELCSLAVCDIKSTKANRMVVTIQKSKTDQLGEGHQVAVLNGNYVKPISRLREWLESSRIQTGFIFQSLAAGGIPTGKGIHPSEVARIVKRHVSAIGLNPTDYSAHSLRAGFVTSAAVHHARLDKIMEITRHRNAETVLRYIRDQDTFTDHAGSAFL